MASTLSKTTELIKGIVDDVKRDYTGITPNGDLGVIAATIARDAINRLIVAQLDADIVSTKQEN